MSTAQNNVPVSHNARPASHTKRKQVQHLSLRPALRAAHLHLVATKAEMQQIYKVRRLMAVTSSRSEARRTFAEELAELRDIEREQQMIYRNLSEVRRFLRGIRRI